MAGKITLIIYPIVMYLLWIITVKTISFYSGSLITIAATIIILVSTYGVLKYHNQRKSRVEGFPY